MTALDQITPLSAERLAEIRDLNVDSCSADAPYNPDVWALEYARMDLLAEVDRLRKPPPPGELRGLDTMCAALHAATETDPVVKEVAWRTFALIRAHREQSAEVERLQARIAWLDDYIAGVGGISCIPEHPDGEVERLNATLKRVQAVAESPVSHRCDRDGRAGWVRLRDLQEALKDGGAR